MGAASAVLLSLLPSEISAPGVTTQKCGSGWPSYGSHGLPSGRSRCIANFSNVTRAHRRVDVDASVVAIAPGFARRTTRAVVSVPSADAVTSTQRHAGGVRTMGALDVATRDPGAFTEERSRRNNASSASSASRSQSMRYATFDSPSFDATLSSTGDVA